MRAKSIKGKSAEEIKIALQQSRADGFVATLAVVFISVKQDRKVVCELLVREGIDVFGTTSCGEFTDGFQSEGCIAVLLLDVSRSLFSIIFEEAVSRSIAEAAKALSEKAKQRFENPSLILCSTGINAQGELFDGSVLVHTVKETLGNDKSFFGGMAGDDMTFTGSYVFTAQQETDCGIAAVVFDAERIGLCGMAITGWKRWALHGRLRKVQATKCLLLTTYQPLKCT